MRLYIKNMVCIRCQMVLKSNLEKLGLHYTRMELGIVEIKENISSEERDELNTSLQKSGLELLEDKKAILIEKIKKVIVEMVHYLDEFPKTKFSVYLSEKLHLDYTYLAHLFSEVQGTTIEHYIIFHKIERVKELLLYDELSLTEITDKLQYSSRAHLSTQFKKITGLTLARFRQQKSKKRGGLENV